MYTVGDSDFLATRDISQNRNSDILITIEIEIIRLTIEILHGIFRSPLSRVLVVFHALAFVEPGNFWHERVARVWIGEECEDAEEKFVDGQDRRPLPLQKVETDGARLGNIAVVDLRLELHARRFEGKGLREEDVQLKDTPLVRGASGPTMLADQL